MASDWAIAADGKVTLGEAFVFEAWTNPRIIRQWMAPGTMRVTDVTVDPVEHGQWRIEMQDVDGVSQVAQGTFITLKPHRYIELTWGWEGQHYTTTIAVSIDPIPAGVTEISIEQKGFPSMDAAQSHESGWSHCLEKLAKLSEDAG